MSKMNTLPKETRLQPFARPTPEPLTHDPLSIRPWFNQNCSALVPSLLLPPRASLPPSLLQPHLPHLGLETSAGTRPKLD